MAKEKAPTPETTDTPRQAPAKEKPKQKPKPEVPFRFQVFPKLKGSKVIKREEYENGECGETLLLPKKQSDAELFKYLQEGSKEKPYVLSLEHEGIAMKIVVEQKGQEIIIKSADWAASVTPNGITPKRGKIPEVVIEALAMTKVIILPNRETWKRMQEGKPVLGGRGAGPAIPYGRILPAKREQSEIEHLEEKYGTNVEGWPKEAFEKLYGKDTSKWPEHARQTYQKSMEE